MIQIETSEHVYCTERIIVQMTDGAQITTLTNVFGVFTNQALANIFFVVILS